MSGRGAVLDEGVVGADGGGRAVALGGGEEDQPELVADAETGGREAPVVGDQRLRLGLKRQGKERGEGARSTAARPRAARGRARTRPGRPGSALMRAVPFLRASTSVSNGPRGCISNDPPWLQTAPGQRAPVLRPCRGKGIANLPSRRVRAALARPAPGTAITTSPRRCVRITNLPPAGVITAVTARQNGSPSQAAQRFPPGLRPAAPMCGER